MTRADLLLLEVMMHLGEGYRRAYDLLARPPRQKFLAGRRCLGAEFFAPLGIRPRPNTGFSRTGCQP